MKADGQPCCAYLICGFACWERLGSQAETCSSGQQPAPKPALGEIKTNFPQSQLRLRLLTAPIRALIEIRSDAPAP